MTTTDPTPLAERIAREHYRRVRSSGWGSEVICACGHEFAHGTYGEVAAHIATVTERAVRERIAAEIEEFEPDDLALIHMPDWREAMYDAARIARGATDD